MKKTTTGFIAAAMLAALTTSGWAASVGPAGYTNDFSMLPPAADWSYVSVAGSAGDITTVQGLDVVVQGLSAASINNRVVSDDGNLPVAPAYATWSASGHYLQTRPNDVKFMAQCWRLRWCFLRIGN